MPAPASAALVLAAGLGIEVSLELPREAVAPGETVFARAHTSGASGAVSAEAEWFGRRIALPVEASGSAPVVLGVPLEATGRATLAVVVRDASGAGGRSEAEIALDARSVPPPESWELDHALAAQATAEASQAEATSLLAALALAESSERLSRGNFSAPVTAPRFGRFGAARSIGGRDAAGEEAPVHRGVDYALRRRASIRPPAPGVVLAIPSLPLLGETVVVGHGQGVASIFAHLESALVRPGDRVSRDSVLGWAGDTGVANGLMLHYGLYVHGIPVDPRSWERLPTWLRDEPPPLAATANAPLGASGPAPATAPAAISAPTPLALPAAGATTTPTPEMPTPPLPTPVPATTPALPPEVATEQLAELARAGVESRLPGTRVEVRVEPGDPRKPLDIEVALSGLGRMPFYRAVETVAFVIGELTLLTPARTGRLSVLDTETGQRVRLLTRDARQLWRERMGLATPLSQDEH